MKAYILIFVIIVCAALAGCGNSKEEKIELNKGEMEVTRTEDVLYDEVGENPFKSDFREKTEKMDAEMNAAMKEIEEKRKAKEEAEKKAQASREAGPDKLQITDTKLGTGAAVKDGDTVNVHYKGTLTDGTKFDASYDRNEPFSFTVGNGDVIKGWDQGLVGMKVGGKRKLVVPPSLAYGDRDLGVIPANSTLIFEIELLGIE